MSDAFYNFIWFVGRHPFWMSSYPMILHRDRIENLKPPFILAANHTSYFDVPILIRHSPWKLDFLSITEVFRNPLVAAFMYGMNAFPLDRSRSDPKTVKILLDRLAKNRVIAMFPEGHIPRPERAATL